MARQRERQGSPLNELITVGPTEREAFRARREELELTQKDVAQRVGASGGTISNVETGRHPQIEKRTYLRLIRLYKLRPQSDTDQAKRFEELIEAASDLEEADLLAVRALIDQLRILRNSGTTRPK